MPRGPAVPGRHPLCCRVPEGTGAERRGGRPRPLLTPTWTDAARGPSSALGSGSPGADQDGGKAPRVLPALGAVARWQGRSLRKRGVRPGVRSGGGGRGCPWGGRGEAVVVRALWKWRRPPSRCSVPGTWLTGSGRTSPATAPVVVSRGCGTGAPRSFRPRTRIPSRFGWSGPRAPPSWARHTDSGGRSLRQGLYLGGGGRGSFQARAGPATAGRPPVGRSGQPASRGGEARPGAPWKPVRLSSPLRASLIRDRGLGPAGTARRGALGWERREGCRSRGGR